MARRSYSNDRYRPEAKVGSTRKSASKAKPVRKQGTVEVSSGAPAKKTAKPGSDRDWMGLPTSPEIKKWRRIWWALLLGGLAMIGIAYAIPELRANMTVQRIVASVVLGCSLLAVGIDLFVIRKLRRALIESTQKKKSPKQEKAEKAASGSEGKDAS